MWMSTPIEIIMAKIPQAGLLLTLSPSLRHFVCQVALNLSGWGFVICNKAAASRPLVYPSVIADDGGAHIESSSARNC